MAKRGRPPGSSNRSESSTAASALVGAPTCPEELDEFGKQRWNELMVQLTAMEIITKVDGDSMQQYCAADSRRHVSQAMITQFGPVLKGPNGLYRSPYLDVVIQASKEMQKLSRVLGLDPISRKKLGVRIPKPHNVAAHDSNQEPLLPNPKPSTAADVRMLLDAQIHAVLQDPELTTEERARCVGFLSRLSLRAIEDSELAASLEAMKEVLKTRKNGEPKS